MNKRRFAKVSLWTAALAPLLAACVEDTYDLSKDIDMNVTIGGDMSIPGSGTEEFTLEDIMDLDSNSVVKADDVTGDYALSKADTTDTDVSVDAVHIEKPESTETTKELYFDTPATAGEVEANVEDVATDFTFRKDDVTPDITTLTSADVDFTAHLIFKNKNSNASKITLKKGFTIELKMKGQTRPDGLDFDGLSSTEYGYDTQTQTIKFPEDKVIGSGNELSIPVHFTRIHNFPDKQGLYEPGHFLLTINAVANGKATIQGAVSEGITTGLVMSSDVPGFFLQRVTGTIDPEINIDVDPITVEGLPDFLQGDVNLDLTNPCIKLTLENGSPADVNLKGRMTWKKNGIETDEDFLIGTDLDKPSDKTITLKRNATSEYYLSRIPMTDLPAGAKNIVMGDDIHNLIRTIPDEINLTDVEAKALPDETTVVLGEDGANYGVKTVYELNAPLQMGEDLNIVYKDTVNGWGGDLEKITIDSAVIEMDVFNGIPLKCEFESVEAIDADGKVFNDVTVTPVEKEIKAGLKLSDNETATESHVKLTLKGTMKNLDGLIITLKGFQAEEENLKKATLNKAMKLQLTNIRIHVVKGITVDLN